MRREYTAIAASLALQLPGALELYRPSLELVVVLWAAGMALLAYAIVHQRRRHRREDAELIERIAADPDVKAVLAMTRAMAADTERRRGPARG